MNSCPSWWVTASLQSTVFYAVMVDETTDKANNEQVVLVFWWVDNALVAHEEFVGLYLTDSITSEALVAVIKDTLLRKNLTTVVANAMMVQRRELQRSYVMESLVLSLLTANNLILSVSFLVVTTLGGLGDWCNDIYLASVVA